MRAITLLLTLGVASCGGDVGPVAIDPRHDTCAHCRMPVSQPALAAQLVARGEEPLFFDDLGCLAKFLAGGSGPRDAMAFVAEHRTGEWLNAREAAYARVVSLETPMGSHLVAHRDRASRTIDLGSRAYQQVSYDDVFTGAWGAGDQP